MGSDPTPPTKRGRYHKKALSPRLAKLDKEFEEAGGEWREYPVSKLFKIKSTLSFNKDMLTVGDGYDYVTRTSQNQGILQSTGFVNQENVNDAGVWSLGLLQMDFFYRNKPWYAGQFVRKVIPLISMTRHYVLYFQTLLNKLKPKLLSGLVRDVDETFLSSHFILPMKNGEIDFLYIENYIKTLEAERIETLEAYLTVTGLKEYHLTKNDEKILDTFTKLTDTESRVEYLGTYTLSDLFYLNSSKRKYNANSIEFGGEFPYVARGESNNGIRGYITEPEEFLNPAGSISFGQDTATMFYQKEAYFTGDKIKILQAKDIELDRFTGQYIITAMRKSFSTFSWGSSSFNEHVLKSVEVSLPTQNNQPDYTFMSGFIKVIEKLVIKDLVEWTDKKIQATKGVVAQH